MIRVLMEIPCIDELTCGECPCRDSESSCCCELDYAINRNYKNVTTIYDSRPKNCPLIDIDENNYIPYLMHKEMDIPISECQKAYDVAIDYLRSQGKVRG